MFLWKFGTAQSKRFYIETFNFEQILPNYLCLLEQHEGAQIQSHVINFFFAMMLTFLVWISTFFSTAMLLKKIDVSFERRRKKPTMSTLQLDMVSDR